MSPPAVEVSGARLLRNTVVNAAGTSGGMIATLVLTPFMLHRLGAPLFGVWALALTLTVGAGYLALSDLGLQQASVRFLADARGRDDVEAQSTIFSATLAIFVAVAVPLAGVLVAVAPLLTHVFSVQRPLRAEAQRTFAIIGGQLALDLPALAFRAVLESAQRFGPIRMIELGRSLAFAGLTVVVLLRGHSIVAVATASIVAAACGLVAYAAITLAGRDRVPLRIGSIRRAELRELFTFSSALFVTRIISVAYRQMDKVIIGIALTVTAVTTYEVANRIQAGLMLVVGFGGSAILPAASLARDQKPVMRGLFLRSTSYTLALILPLAVWVFVYARMIIVAWVGPGQTGATTTLRLFGLWVAVVAFDGIADTMLVAAGRLRPLVVMSGVWLVGNLGLSIALVHVWGIAGVVAGTVIASGPLIVAYTVVSLREFEISWREWSHRVLLPNIPGPAVQGVAGFATLRWAEELPARAAVLAALAGGVALSVGLYWLVGLGPGERAYLRNIVARARGKKPVGAPG